VLFLNPFRFPNNDKSGFFGLSPVPSPILWSRQAFYRHLLRFLGKPAEVVRLQQPLLSEYRSKSERNFKTFERLLCSLALTTWTTLANLEKLTSVLSYKAQADSNPKRQCYNREERVAQNGVKCRFRVTTIVFGKSHRKNGGTYGTVNDQNPLDFAGAR